MPGALERSLVLTVRTLVALLLATPLLVSFGTMYPYTVGKTVYARILVEVAFALWAVLAAFRPDWRPPRSVLLALVAAGLAVALVAAYAGVSPPRSLWSTYGRQFGVVDTAHWLAAVVVTVSVFRRPAQWRALFAANVAIGTVVALIAAASYFRIEVPYYGLLSERNFPRVAGTLGNATFLGGYLVVVASLAAGLLARTLSRWKKARGHGGAAGAPWVALALAAAAALAVWVVTLTGSIGAFGGLLAAALTPPVLYGLLARRRAARLATGVGVTVAGLAATALAATVIARVEPPPAYADVPVNPIVGNPLLVRALEPERALFPLRKRVDLWQAGVRGFLERPLLGYGPCNFLVPFGRYTSGWGGPTLIQDHAHNMVLEEAVTKGAAGLAAYLALWGALAWAIVGGMRRAERAERRLVAFAGGALIGYFVHGLTLFTTPATSVQWVLLVAFVVSLETAERPRRWLHRERGSPAGRLAAGGLAALALVLAAAGMGTSRAIHDGATALYDAETQGTERFMDNLRRGIHAFEPLGTQVRLILFENLVANWEVLRTGHAEEARRLIAWVDEETRAAVAAEPDNWRLHQALARLYTVVAETDPDYETAAAFHVARARTLAPAIDPLGVPELPPEPPPQGTGARE